MFRHSPFVAALLALTLLALPASAASTNHFYQRSTGFRKATAATSTCAQTDTYTVYTPASVQQYPDSLGNYMWDFGNPTGTNCAVNFDFAMPAASTGPTVTPVISVDVGASGINPATKKICFRGGASFANQQTGSAVGGWPYVSGAEGTLQTAGQAPFSTAAGIEFPVTLPAITGELVSGGGASHAACSGTNCAGFAGKVYIERCACGSGGCAAGTDAAGDAYVFQVDVQSVGP